MELSKLRSVVASRTSSSRRVQKQHSHRQGQVVVVGASILDFTAKIKTAQITVRNILSEEYSELDP